MKLEERFNAYRTQLNENDLIIWRYIRAHGAQCARLSIEQLGAKCNVSRTTILRFAKKLGYRGYSEMRLYIAMESEQVQYVPDAIERTCQAYQQVMDEMRERDVTRLLQWIDGAENLYVYGSGMVQNALAKEIRRIFLAADKWFYHVEKGTEADVLLYSITERDLVIMLSVSGETESTVELARALKVRGIPLVSITLQKENTLSQLCDIRLYIGSVEFDEQERDIYYRPTAAFFLLVELLFLKYVEYIKQKGEDYEPGQAHRAELS